MGGARNGGALGVVLGESGAGLAGVCKRLLANKIKLRARGAYAQFLISF